MTEKEIFKRALIAEGLMACSVSIAAIALRIKIPMLSFIGLGISAACDGAALVLTGESVIETFRS